MPTYELFNFEDPICAAVRAMIGSDAVLQRETTELDDIATQIRFVGGAATGHTAKAPDGVKVYDSYAGGSLEITVSRYRRDAETVAEQDADATVARDPLTLRVSEIRHKLRHAKTTFADHLPLNDQLSSPKITRIRPGQSLAGHDPETDTDFILLTWALDYHIPLDIWPKVIVGDNGYILVGDNGQEVVGDGPAQS